MAIKYVKTFTTALKNKARKQIVTLLWGDPGHVLSSSGERVEVHARGLEDWVSTKALSD